jgi:hypothetical protein
MNDEVALLATAELATTRARRQRLLGQVERREFFRRELGDEIVNLGAPVRTRGSAGPHVADFLRRVRSALVGKHEGDAYRACAKAEAKTEALYVEALRHDLPTATRRTIERQLDEIRSDQRALRLQQWESMAAPRVLDERGPANELARWSDDGGA